MSEALIESVARSNGKASFAEFLHDNETHQSHKTLPSGSCHAQGGSDKLENSSQSVTKEKDRCNSLTESSPHSTKIFPSSEATCGSDDRDSTKSPPQTNAVSPDKNDQVTKAKSDHEKNGASSSISSSTAETASPGLSEPIEGPAVVIDPQPVDDPRAVDESRTVDNNPIYSIGEMKIYSQTQKKIPRLYEARWQIIRLDIFDRVCKRLRRGRFMMLNMRKTPAIIELMSAGVTKARSIPAVLVVIPHLADEMQKFLETDRTVKSRCKPEDGTTVELLALACKGSPTLIGMPNDPLGNHLESQSDSNSLSDGNASLISADDSDINPGLHTLSNTTVLEVDPQSFCVVHDPRYIAGNVKHGMGIRLITKDGPQCVHGTCGGLLQLKVPNQPPQQVGLMAGHLLEQLGQDSKEEYLRMTDASLIIGNISYPQGLAELPRYDWALFDATKLDFEQNITDQNSFTVAQGPEFPDTSTVVVVRTSKGEVTGTLSSSSSGIMLNPDQGFVPVRTIMMSKDSILTKGDSGSWVFQKEYEKVYGYIIAIDDNYHAYMVPMHAAIAEIQSNLGAVSVSLAISTDPNPQTRPWTTHEQIGQTDRSITYSDVDESVQLSSILSSTFSSRSDSIDMSSILSFLPTVHEGSSSRNLHPYPRPNHTTVSSPATSVASLEEQLLQVDQGQVEAQDMLAKAASASSSHEQLPQVDQSQPQSDQDQQLESQEKLTKATSVTSSQQQLPQGDQSKPQADQIQLESQDRLTKATSVASSHHQLPRVDPGQLESQDTLAKAFLRQGLVVEAIRILESVVETRERVFGRDHASHLASQHELAVAYLQNGQISKAIRILKHVVEREAAILENSVIDRLTSQHELARAYLAAGQVSEAIKLLEDVVAVKTSTLGKSDPYLLASQMVLAEAYLSANRASEAISILENVFAVATAPSNEFEMIRASSLHWLNLARKQRDGSDSGRLAGQRSKPVSVFIQPRK